MLKKFRETGGSFWLSDAQLNRHISSENCAIRSVAENEKAIFTSSGRGAIKLLLESIKQDRKRALLPSYTCDSVLKPFKEAHYEMDFYLLDNDLSIRTNDFLRKIESYNPSIIFFQSYFGFDTLNNILPYYKSLKERGIVIIEDITHSWLSGINKTDSDYYIISFRKWMEIPDGGAQISIDRQFEESSLEFEHTEVITLFSKASQLKNEYMNSGNEDLKDLFRPMFYRIEEILNTNTEVFRMSDMTATILNNADFELIKNKRRKNYLRLSSMFPCVGDLAPVFNSLEDGIVPLYFPVIVRNDREQCQQYFAERKVYCPVIWPIPANIKTAVNENDLSLFRKILCIPCDQRYDEEEMDKIAQIGKDYIR
jgi:dTDP-4-amino-4,6-dideoxygalactose transaminase